LSLLGILKSTQEENKSKESVQSDADKDSQDNNSSPVKFNKSNFKAINLEQSLFNENVTQWGYASPTTAFGNST
jgi:hypothetical protein